MNEILAELRECGFLDGKIRILHEVDDSVLACLYRNCRFTMFPSFCEGWGLPVQEGLAFGRPCRPRAPVASLRPG